MNYKYISNTTGFIKWVATQYWDIRPSQYVTYNSNIWEKTTEPCTVSVVKVGNQYEITIARDDTTDTVDTETVDPKTKKKRTQKQ